MDHPDLFLDVERVLPDYAGLRSGRTSVSTIAAIFSLPSSEWAKPLALQAQWTPSSTTSKFCGVWWSAEVVHLEKAEVGSASRREQKRLITNFTSPESMSWAGAIHGA